MLRAFLIANLRIICFCLQNMEIDILFNFHWTIIWVAPLTIIVVLVLVDVWIIKLHQWGMLVSSNIIWLAYWRDVLNLWAMALALKGFRDARVFLRAAFEFYWGYVINFLFKLSVVFVAHFSLGYFLPPRVHFWGVVRSEVRNELFFWWIILYFLPTVALIDNLLLSFEIKVVSRLFHGL